MTAFDWRASALCAQTDPEIFFPEDDDEYTLTEARSICSRCVSRVECLVYALETDQPYGVFAGLTAAQRQKLRRSVTQAVAA